MNRRRVSRKGAAALDLMGIALLAALGGWFVVAARVSGGDPGSLIAVVGLSLVGLLIGMTVAVLLGPLIVPGVIATGAVVIAVVSAGDLVRSGPLGGPFGYANATGAFFAQASIAAVVVGVAARTPALRMAAWIVAAGLAVVVVGSRSIAASALVVILPLVALAIAKWGSPRVAVVVLGGLFLMGLAVTAVVGAGYPIGEALDPIVRTVGERRAVLWRDAVTIMGEEPLTGAGVGSFLRLSPTARDDADARWAHNEFLEIGAETGVPGLLLLVLVFLWAFARMWVVPVDAVTAVGAVAVAALGIHASIDYIMHFPAIPIAAALLVGSTTASTGRTT